MTKKTKPAKKRQKVSLQICMIHLQQFGHMNGYICKHLSRGNLDVEVGMGDRVDCYIIIAIHVGKLLHE